MGLFLHFATEVACTRFSSVGQLMKLAIKLKGCGLTAACFVRTDQNSLLMLHATLKHQTF